MRVPPLSSSSRRGTALILVLWSLLLLGMAVFGVVDLVGLSVEHTSRSELLLEARTLSLSGLGLGQNPQLIKNDPLFFNSPSQGRQYNVSISSEGSRLNLNFVLLSGHREILVNLFNQWGLAPADADEVADCLYDWITPGVLRSLNGAKAADYERAGLPQRPSGQPFQSLDEVGWVMHMDLVQKARPNWQDSFTLWSSGPLNVNEAPAELIAAVFGCPVTQVQTITNARNGRDGIAGTLDDVPIQSLATAQQSSAKQGLGLTTPSLQAQLGLSDLAMGVLGKQVSLQDNNRRIESVGQVEGMQVMITAVIGLNSTPLKYYLWSEQ